MIAEMCLPAPGRRSAGRGRRPGENIAEVAFLTGVDRRADAIEVLTRALSGGLDVILLR